MCRQRCKHVDIRCHFIRSPVSDGKMVADVVTKPVTKLWVKAQKVFCLFVSLEWELLDMKCMTAKIRRKRIIIIIITFLFYFNSIFFILMFLICHVYLMLNAKINEIANIRVLNCIFFLFDKMSQKSQTSIKRVKIIYIIFSLTSWGGRTTISEGYVPHLLKKKKLEF